MIGRWSEGFLNKMFVPGDCVYSDKVASVPPESSVSSLYDVVVTLSVTGLQSQELI